MHDNDDAAARAVSVAAAWLDNPNTRASADEVASFVCALHRTVVELAHPGAAAAEQQASTTEHPAAVSVRKSLASRDHIISMVDGKPNRSLTRHLSARGLTPDEYRRRYGLKTDYPMVAPAYSEARSELSKRLGLGRKPTKADNQESSQPQPQARQSSKRASVAEAKAAARKHLGT